MTRRALLLAMLAIAGAPAARADEAGPTVELISMGPGNDIFEAFGHATLCVTDDGHPDGICYNYGVTDFRNPVALVWDFVRGRARFWVSPSARVRTIALYTRDDRSIYVQRLPLPPEQARALAAALARDLLPENRYYLYHHFKDNCTTRLRDHLDRVVGGGFRAALADRGSGLTLRELSTTGYLGSIPMLIATELVEGYFADRQASLWEAMFLPDYLRRGVEEYFSAKPEVLNLRRGPVPEGDPLLGRHTIAAGGVALALLLGIGALARRRGAFRAALILVGAALGLLGAAYATLAIFSTMPEMRHNELLLVFLPTDLALMFLAGRALRVYLFARLALVGVLAIAAAGGLLVQPLWAPLVAVGAPLAVAAIGAQRIYHQWR
jgi:hypothetical protein